MPREKLSVQRVYHKEELEDRNKIELELADLFIRSVAHMTPEELVSRKIFRIVYEKIGNLCNMLNCSFPGSGLDEDDLMVKAKITFESYEEMWEDRDDL